MHYPFKYQLEHGTASAIGYMPDASLRQMELLLPDALLCHLVFWMSELPPPEAATTGTCSQKILICNLDLYLIR